MSESTNKKTILNRVVDGCKTANDWLVAHPVISIALGIGLLSVLKYRD